MVATIIISCIVGACAIAAAVYLIVRKVKNKGRCGGCGGQCGGCAAACPAHDADGDGKTEDAAKN